MSGPTTLPPFGEHEGAYWQSMGRRAFLQFEEWQQATLANPHDFRNVQRARRWSEEARICYASARYFLKLQEKDYNQC